MVRHPGITVVVGLHPAYRYPWGDCCALGLSLGNQQAGTGASTCARQADGSWVATFDTARLPNGSYTLYASVNYYDSQGVMVRKDLNVKSAKELGGATVCVQPGTTTELNLADWFRANKLEFKPVVIEKYDEIVRAFQAGRCDAFTTDKSQLAGTRTTLDKPDSYVILPEDFSKEPLGPMVRQGDEQWFNVVRWALFAMIEAEEYGITSKNVDEMLKSTNPNIQRILGVTPGMGKNLGVDEKWAYNIIKQVGNYGESFERNLGAGSALKLPRGLNEQWRKGGIMYAWPIR